MIALRTKAMWGAGVAIGLGVVAALVTVGSWYGSSRKVAIAWVEALRDHRRDDARTMLDPALEKRVATGDTAAPGDPTDGLALLWSANDVRFGGLVQIGFADPFVPYGCFDGEADGGRRFWMIVRKVSAWKVAEVRTTEPEACTGATP